MPAVVMWIFRARGATWPPLPRRWAGGPGLPQHHAVRCVSVCGLTLCQGTLCPSGLRGWTQVPLARAAWAQIPQVSLFQPLGLGYPALPLSSLPEGCFTYYAALVLERSGPAEQQDSPMLAWAHRHQRLPAVPDSSCSYADPSGSWPNLASPTPRMGGYVWDRACHVAPVSYTHLRAHET